MLTTKRVEIINKKKFANKVVLDENVKAFMVHVTSISLSKPNILIHPARKVQIASLITKEVKIPTKYSDFADVFSEKKALVLPKQTNLNKHAIKLKDGK